MKLIYVEIVVLFYLDKLYWFYLCKCLEFNFKNSADTLYLLLLKLFSLAFRSLNIFLFIGLSLLSSDKQGVFFQATHFLAPFERCWIFKEAQRLLFWIPFNSSCQIPFISQWLDWFSVPFWAARATLWCLHRPGRRPYRTR